MYFSRICFFSIILCISFTTYGCRKSPYAPKGLTKLSGQELIDRARIGNFPNIDELVYKNQRGEIITRDSLGRIKPLDELAFDDYINSEGVVEVTIVRPATEKDKELRKKINQAIKEGPILKKVPIKCDSIGLLLDVIRETDQQNRTDHEIISREVDLKNLEIVVSLLEQCGMPTRKDVSPYQLSAIWLVIQHSRLIYQKKYLPIFKESSLMGDLNKSDIALMEDRILISEGKPQIYGSQVRVNNTTGEFELFEVTEPQYLNQRRSEVGLNPIEDYLLEWGIEFKIEQERK